ncbi:hypothetical protein ACMD2_08946 [Ananas comosus]|uniref:Uncharacterized protein n=1 Tax=Ananas comosus TaxID=4615 RepID=A0A199V2J0_ANACO|nr:hypothetical protein ACMD2_08946 [Ananas comosus]
MIQAIASKVARLFQRALGRPDLLPNAVAIAMSSCVEIGGDNVSDVVSGPHLDDDLLVNHRHIEIGVGDEDAQRTCRMDAVSASYCRQRADLVLQSPSGEVYNAGDPRMCENVGVALHDLIGRERPQPLRGSGVVIVDERDRLLRPPAEHPGRLPAAVTHPPQLPLHCRLQYPLRREVERRRRPAHRAHPVHQLLPLRILIARRLSVAPVRQRAPYLRHHELRRGVLHVHPRDARRKPLGEVEPPPVEAEVGFEPVEPVGELALDPRVEVVDVRCRCEVEARVRVARAVGELAVVAADHGGAPVEAVVGGAALEDAVHAAPVLLVGAPVVDHDVGHGFDAAGVQRGYQGPELLLVAVLGGA